MREGEPDGILAIALGLRLGSMLCAVGWEVVVGEIFDLSASRRVISSMMVGCFRVGL